MINVGSQFTIGQLLTISVVSLRWFYPLFLRSRNASDFWLVVPLSQSTVVRPHPVNQVINPNDVKRDITDSAPCPADEPAASTISARSSPFRES